MCTQKMFQMLHSIENWPKELLESVLRRSLQYKAERNCNKLQRQTLETAFQSETSNNGWRKLKEANQLYKKLHIKA